jgi:hypothetical protein
VCRLKIFRSSYYFLALLRLMRTSVLSCKYAYLIPIIDIYILRMEAVTDVMHVTASANQIHDRRACAATVVNTSPSSTY